MTINMNLQIFTDGGSRGNPGNAAIGGVVFDQNKTIIYEFSKYIGVATNNEAEYLAVKHALNWIREFKQQQKISQITFYLDSKLVVEQINQNWKIKEPRMKALASECWKIMESLQCSTDFVHVLREKNKEADLLVNQALDAHQL